MCRSTEDPRFYQNSSRIRRRNRLDIKTFSLRFSIISSSPSNTAAQKVNPLPGSLTLHYLPRISGSPLDINDSPIPSDSSAFVTLHRVITSHSPLGKSTPTKEVVFASRERVRASEGVRFEVYWREEKVVKGVFRKKDYVNDDDFIAFTGEWKVDCRCAVESHASLSLGLGLFEVSRAEACVEIEGDGHRVMSDKVEMAVGRNRTKRKKKSRGFVGLEEIPEEREVDDDNDSVLDSDSSSSSASSSSSSCCCCGDGDSELHLGSVDDGDGGGGDDEVIGDEEKQGLEMEIEAVRWAVDVGIWVMCLGVGYLLTKSSTASFRRRRRSLFF